MVLERQSASAPVQTGGFSSSVSTSCDAIVNGTGIPTAALNVAKLSANEVSRELGSHFANMGSNSLNKSSGFCRTGINPTGIFSKSAFEIPNPYSRSTSCATAPFAKKTR